MDEPQHTIEDEDYPYDVDFNLTMSTNQGHCYFRCPLTKVCHTDNCFWKQMDCYGRNYWVAWGGHSGGDPDKQKSIDDQTALNHELQNKYGDAIFPTWSCDSSMNCILLRCPKYTGKKKKCWHCGQTTRK